MLDILIVESKDLASCRNLKYCTSELNVALVINQTNRGRFVFTNQK